MRVSILTDKFNPWQELTEYAEHIPDIARFGALSVFVGSMRDMNQGEMVESMELEYYPEMTQASLEDMVRRAMIDYALGDVLLLHRVGQILPTEPIVLIAVWSVHREDAYSANRQIMEALKSEAPFWKKEKLADGERWVSNTTVTEPGGNNENH